VKVVWVVLSVVVPVSALALLYVTADPWLRLVPGICLLVAGVCVGRVLEVRR
jgi:hypothetical protein